ncbi:hypothetical protein B0H15DRAFT_799226 [Mycena belliarum]|uniref:Uncharacterized protein n=1 Tax=Mycena belliarum TaxID=1033014 RepID=A0AAD6U744_9AGAR|nr:hypothetical protein B0H15DRAFT_799226 [Mycena belliae]
MQSFTFDSAKILNTTLRSLSDDGGALIYTTTTVTTRDPGSVKRQATSLMREGQDSRDAVIDWKQSTFSVAEATRPIAELRKKRTTFASSRYWSWFDCEECKVKYEGSMWTVLSYSGTLLAEFMPQSDWGHRGAVPML